MVKSTVKLNYYGVSVVGLDNYSISGDVLANIRRAFMKTGIPQKSSFSQQVGNDVYIYEFSLKKDAAFKWSVYKNRHLYQTVKFYTNDDYYINTLSPSGKVLKSEFFDLNHNWVKTVFYDEDDPDVDTCTIIPYVENGEPVLFKFAKGQTKPLVLYKCNMPKSKESILQLSQQMPEYDAAALSDTGVVFFSDGEKKRVFDAILYSIESRLAKNSKPKTYISQEDAENGFSLRKEDFNLNKNLNRTFDITQSGYFGEESPADAGASAEIQLGSQSDTQSEVRQNTETTIPENDRQVTDAQIADLIKVVQNFNDSTVNAAAGIEQPGGTDDLVQYILNSTEGLDHEVQDLINSNNSEQTASIDENALIEKILATGIDSITDETVFDNAKADVDTYLKEDAAQGEADGISQKLEEDIFSLTLKTEVLKQAFTTGVPAVKEDILSETDMGVPTVPVVETITEEPEEDIGVIFDKNVEETTAFDKKVSVNDKKFQFVNLTKTSSGKEEEELKTTEEQEESETIKETKPVSVPAVSKEPIPDKTTFVSKEVPALQIENAGEAYYYYGDVDDASRRTGRGRTVMENGMTAYEGGYHEGKRDGFGSFYYKNGNLCYTGNWKDNKKDGAGLCRRDSDGVMQLGKWQDDKAVGLFTRINASGDITYIGKFKEGKRDGVGITFDENDNPIISVWKEDRQEQVLYSVQNPLPDDNKI